MDSKIRTKGDGKESKVIQTNKKEEIVKNHDRHLLKIPDTSKKEKKKNQLMYL